MAYAEITYRVTDGVAVVTLNRPDRLNAWTGVMEGEVRAAMRAATDDDAVRVIVLTGAGRGFCAGADMQSLQDIQSDGRAATRGVGPFDPWRATTSPRPIRTFQPCPNRSSPPSTALALAWAW